MSKEMALDLLKDLLAPGYKADLFAATGDDWMMLVFAADGTPKRFRGHNNQVVDEDNVGDARYVFAEAAPQ